MNEMNKAWKRVYKVNEFEIRKRLSRNVIEDKQIELNDEIEFVFVVDGVIYAHTIHKDELLKIICAPLIIHPKRVNVQIPNQEADETGTIITCYHCKQRVHIDDLCGDNPNAYHSE